MKTTINLPGFTAGLSVTGKKFVIEGLRKCTTSSLNSLSSSEIIPAMPKAFLDRYNACLKEACTSAGGKWKEGCSSPSGVSFLQSLAIFGAYHINAQDCLWSTIGGTILSKAG